MANMNRDNTFDDLEAFLHWWWAIRPINTPSDASLVHQKDTYGVVLYRQAPYQVELFNVKPNSEVVSHYHPNVDSFEVYIGGDIKFMCDGTWFNQTTLGTKIRVLPNSWHGGLFGEKGGCFLSVQKWLNGVPLSFVGDDWKDEAGAVSYKDSGN